MKTVFIILAAVALLALLVYGVGSLLPRDHVAVRRIVLKSATPDAVWARLADATVQSNWRKDVRQVTRLPDRDGHEVWREEFTSGNALIYETLESTPPSRLARKIVDEEMFGGTWTIIIAPEGAGTSVTVTEAGWVASPPFRLIAKYVMGHSSTIESYLRHLATSFGEESQFAP